MNGRFVLALALSPRKGRCLTPIGALLNINKRRVPCLFPPWTSAGTLFGGVVGCFSPEIYTYPVQTECMRWSNGTQARSLRSVQFIFGQCLACRRERTPRSQAFRHYRQPKQLSFTFRWDAPSFSTERNGVAGVGKHLDRLVALFFSRCTLKPLTVLEERDSDSRYAF